MESMGIEPTNLPILLKGLKQVAAKAPRDPSDFFEGGFMESNSPAKK